VSVDQFVLTTYNLPGKAGGWLGNIHVRQDNRLYVTKFAGYEASIETDARRTTLLSFALDDSDLQN
jgi:hypothetical protein